MQQNELALLDNLKVLTDERGVLYIPNDRLILETWQAMLEEKKTEVISNDELSVGYASKAVTDYGKAEKKVKEYFSEYYKQFENVKSFEKTLVRLINGAKDSTTKQIFGAFKIWVAEACFEYKDLTTEEVSPEQVFQSISLRTNSTKKSVFASVEKYLIQVEDEYKKAEAEKEALFKKRQEDEQALQAYCEVLNQPYGLYVHLLDSMTLFEAQKRVKAYADEEKAKVETFQELNEKHERSFLEETEEPLEITEEPAGEFTASTETGSTVAPVEIAYQVTFNGTNEQLEQVLGLLDFLGLQYRWVGLVPSILQ